MTMFSADPEPTIQVIGSTIISGRPINELASDLDILCTTN